MDANALRVKLLGMAPPLALIFSATALFISHSVDLGSPFLSDLETSAFVEICWSLIAVVVMFVFFRKPGEIARTAAWVSGFAGYLLMTTVNLIPLYKSALDNSVAPLPTHNLLALGLISLAWVVGIGWSFEALTFSISAGDWSRTIWARLGKHSQEK